jgi:hypothetical protein
MPNIDAREDLNLLMERDVALDINVNPFLYIKCPASHGCVVFRVWRANSVTSTQTYPNNHLTTRHWLP